MTAARALRGIEAALRYALYGSIAALFVITCHKFFRFIDAAPYIATDDSLANISVFLAHSGRYGMPAAPFEMGGRAIRLDGMLNYGPHSFLIGAALDWLFGTSYVVQRSVHLLCLALMTVLATVVFRGVALPAAGVFATLLIQVFWTAQWPMVRPDAVTSLLLIATIACGTAALRNGRAWAWFLTGLSAACAAANHQIAWAVVPATILIWLSSLVVADEPFAQARARHLRSFLNVAAGGLVGALTFLVGTGFRIGIMVEFWTTYASVVRQFNAAEKSGFGEILARHLSFAWGSAAPGLTMTLYGLGAAGILVVGLSFLAGPALRRQLCALLVPALLVAGAYHLSLGLYPNFHSGYVIALQITTIWVAGAVVAALLVAASSLAPRLGPAIRVASIPAAVVYALVMAYGIARKEQHWERVAQQQVPYSEYLQLAIAKVPRHATVLGEVTLGLEAGSRYNFVYVNEGVQLLNRIKPEFRRDFSPDFLVIGRTNGALAFLELGGRNFNPFSRNYKTLLQSIQSWQTIYGLVDLVDAPPYGTTRVYSKRGALQPSDAPSVSVYLPDERRWISRLGASLHPETPKVEPLSLTLRLGPNAITTTAAETRVVHLEPGAYLLTVPVSPQVPSSDRAESCFVTATTRLSVDDPGSDLGSGLPLVPCLPGENAVHMITRHKGGELYVSWIGRPQVAGLGPVVIRSILDQQDEREGKPLPPLSAWTLTGSGTRAPADDAELFVGDRSRFGYQLVSPPIPVPPDARGQIVLDVASEHGQVGVGVLGFNEQRWLTPPQAQRKIPFEAAGSDEIRIVIAANNPVELDQPVRFRVRPGGKLFLQRGDPASYVYELTACLRLAEGARPDYCAPAWSSVANAP